jgi:hypothetical protein
VTVSGHEHEPRPDNGPEIDESGVRHQRFPRETLEERKARLAPQIGDRAIRGAQQPVRADPQDPRVKDLGRVAVQRAGRTPPPERTAPPEQRARDRDTPREDRER